MTLFRGLSELRLSFSKKWLIVTVWIQAHLSQGQHSQCESHHRDMDIATMFVEEIGVPTEKEKTSGKIRGWEKKELQRGSFSPVLPRMIMKIFYASSIKPGYMLQVYRFFFWNMEIFCIHIGITSMECICIRSSFLADIKSSVGSLTGSNVFK